jgi:opacity protein-like surface antigen
MASYRAGGQFEEVPGGATRDLSSHAGVAFALGFTAGESAEDYELFYSRQETRIGGRAPFDIDVEYLHFGGTVDYDDPSERYIPYIAGGIGATRMTPHGAGLENETHWSMSLGGGMKIPVTERILVRLELRGYFTWLHDHSDIFCVSSDGSASCAIRVKGNGLFQGEALGGVSFRF